ncbi:hypothetical protein BJ138DRAFT_1168288 [Hygrophoropsis aurantiaca]|uniref:Uncharacterized protein n=1 Tax=Hygrophoropsis aurantiaca TaxID=72124 RepID=A0ACB7ZQ44_9AGAM|nr:hypothetical protein BJ138DRAFT_1168288 [Hygrophoropsis aurantiaca]
MARTATMSAPWVRATTLATSASMIHGASKDNTPRLKLVGYIALLTIFSIAILYMVVYILYRYFISRYRNKVRSRLLASEKAPEYEDPGWSSNSFRCLPICQPLLTWVLRTESPSWWWSEEYSKFTESDAESSFPSPQNMPMPFTPPLQKPLRAVSKSPTIATPIDSSFGSCTSSPKRTGQQFLLSNRPGGAWRIAQMAPDPRLAPVHGRVRACKDRSLGFMPTVGYAT